MITYKETFVNTIYLNFEADYNSKKYQVCVDFAEGIHDIEVRPIESDDDFQSIYDRDFSYLNETDRNILKGHIIEAVAKQDFSANIQYSGGLN